MPSGDHILLLPPNRVWRTYLGGRTLDLLAGKSESAADGHFPEDWVASTTRAVNPDRDLPREGISQTIMRGQLRDFDTLLAEDPVYYLGERHAALHGAQPRMLVKLLDPAIRLHFQVHPTADFARRFLGAPSGKTEAYHILAVRDGITNPSIRLGFHTPPSKQQLRTWIETQDIPAIEAAMNCVPVRPGDTLLVPGGVPHALGEGLLLVEIQEPSDLVVRFEFERGGYVLPESARFMQRGLDFCLDVFDPTPWPPERIEIQARCPPIRRRALGVDSWQDDLITSRQTPCFRVRHTTLRAPVSKSEDSFHLVIVTDGACTVSVGGETHRFQRCDKFFVPAGLRTLDLRPEPECTLLECHPPES